MAQYQTTCKNIYFANIYEHKLKQHIHKNVIYKQLSQLTKKFCYLRKHKHYNCSLSNNYTMTICT